LHYDHSPWESGRPESLLLVDEPRGVIVNWDAIGAVAEAVGAAGVLVTLLYLALQIRQNTKVVGTSNYAQFAMRSDEFARQLAENADLNEIYLRGIEDFEGLTDEEQMRFHMAVSSLVQSYQMMFQLHRRGVLDPELYSTYAETSRQLFTLPGIQQWWAKNRHWYTHDFRAHREEVRGL
jgi:hypothetical protein